MNKNALVTLNDPTSAAAEAYRNLRTGIEFSNIDNPVKTLLVTSAGPNAEKDITLANLAVTMADGGRHVILVDADLHHPQLHTFFGVDNTAGFTDMFRDESAFESPALQNIGDSTLQLLPSGKLPAIPSQILHSAKLVDVLKKLSGMADMVLLSAPPLITVTDAALLASKVDGTLLVIKAGASKRDYVVDAKNRLLSVKANLVGAVLTHAPVDAGLKNYYGK